MLVANDYMANPEQVKVLRQGVEAWNEWRLQHPEIVPDLGEANLGAADQNTRTSMEAVAQAEEDHRVAKLRYDAGKGILLEVLDSLTALVRAQVNHSQALYEFSNAQDDLNRAAGRR